MMNKLNLILVLMATPLLAADFTWAQDTKEEPAATESHQTADRARLIEMVRKLAEQAEALRGEANFAEAESVEAHIRELCRELDPRFLRGNELKRRALEARLAGKLDDVRLYDEAANRIFAELAEENHTGQTPGSPVQGQHPEVAELTRLNQQLRDEIRTLQHQQEAIHIELEKERNHLAQQLARSEEKSATFAARLQEMVDSSRERNHEMQNRLAACTEQLHELEFRLAKSDEEKQAIVTELTQARQLIRSLQQKNDKQSR